MTRVITTRAVHILDVTNEAADLPPVNIKDNCPHPMPPNKYLAESTALTWEYISRKARSSGTASNIWSQASWAPPLAGSACPMQEIHTTRRYTT